MKKVFCLIFALMMFLGLQGSYAFENIVVEEPAALQENTAVTEQQKPIEVSVTFDWLDIPYAQREEQVNKYKKILFEEDSSHVAYTKDEFKQKFAQYFNDKDFKHHYMLTNNGVTDDEDAKYCAFYYKKNTLVMYAIQYKTNPHNAFYYTAFGKLYYVDITSEQYPNFPYYSMQYNRKGQLKSAIYFVSKDIQYMYGPNHEFQGIWYKDKMYDMNGKQTLTRTNW